jgi:hypothetical protein
MSGKKCEIFCGKIVAVELKAIYVTCVKIDRNGKIINLLQF